MSGKKEADLVGEVSGIPYFLLLLLTDLSLVPDSEVMLEVRGRGEEERRGKERKGEEKETSAAASSHPKKRETTGLISINHTPLQFALLRLEVTSLPDACGYRLHPHSP